MIEFLQNDNNFLITALCLIGIIVGMGVLIRINHFAFSNTLKNSKRRHRSLHSIFFERMITALIIVIGIIMIISVLGGIKAVWSSLLGGTAFISAILIFAAQDVIKDILAGLMISLYHPFEIGNRIQLEDGPSGIVEDITLRHIVMRTLDTQRVIIPNSKINSLSLTNYSYMSNIRSAQFDFQVSYDTNIEEAMNVVQDAVMESVYTIPGKHSSVGAEYAPVYFMGFKDSSLELSTTVYFPSTLEPAVVISDINTRVDHAFWTHKIEIPYNFVNVVQRSVSESPEILSKNLPVKKRKQADIVVDSKGNGIEIAIEETAAMGKSAGLTKSEVLRLRLLAEELFGMMRSIIGDVSGHYWVEHDKKLFSIHLATDVSMDREIRRKLLSVSSSGRNAAAEGFMGNIREMISVLMLPEDSESMPGYRQAGNTILMGISSGESSGRTGRAYNWSLKKYINEIQNRNLNGSEANHARDDLEKTLIANLADEVSISIEDIRVEIVVFKRFNGRPSASGGSDSGSGSGSGTAPKPAEPAPEPGSDPAPVPEEPDSYPGSDPAPEPAEPAPDPGSGPIPETADPGPDYGLDPVPETAEPGSDQDINDSRPDRTVTDTQGDVE